MVTGGSIKSGRVVRVLATAENTYEAQIFVNSGERVLISLSTLGVVLVAISLKVSGVARFEAILRTSLGNIRKGKAGEEIAVFAREFRKTRSLGELKTFAAQIKSEIADKTESLSERKLFDGQLDGDLIHLLQLEIEDVRLKRLLVHVSLDVVFDDRWRRSLGSIMALIGVSHICFSILGQAIPKDEALQFVKRMAPLHEVDVTFEPTSMESIEETALLLCSSAREYRPDLLFVVDGYLGANGVAVYAPAIVRDVTGAKITLLNPPAFQRHLALGSPIFAESAIFDAHRLSMEKFGAGIDLIDASVTDIYFQVANLANDSVVQADQPFLIIESKGDKEWFRFSAHFDDDRYLELLSEQESTVTHEILGDSRFKAVRRRSKKPSSVAVVIPMRDQAALTRRCISSIRQNCSYESYRIVVVDNSSVEEESQALFRELEQGGIEVASYPFDFNFAAIANFAVDRVDEEYVLLLNNDIEVTSGDFISEMVALATLQDVGVVGQKLLYPDGDIQHCGIRLGVGEALSEHFQMLDGQPEFGQYLVPTQFSAVTGAAMLLATSTYVAVGGMDATHLKVSYNDIDLCLKVSSMGKLILNNPFSQVLHLESKSRGIDGVSLEKIKRNANERAYMIARWDESFSKDALWPTSK